MVPEAQILLVRAGPEHLVELPIGDVREIMRPLPWIPFAQMPPAVRGVSTLRGRPVPVVDLGSLLIDTPIEADAVGARFVHLRSRSADDADPGGALLCAGVLGVRTVTDDASAPAPLLREAAGATLASLRAQGGALVAALDRSRVRAHLERAKQAMP